MTLKLMHPSSPINRLQCLRFVRVRFIQFMKCNSLSPTYISLMEEGLSFCKCH